MTELRTHKGYIIEFYAGSIFGDWNRSTEGPQVFKTLEEAENKIRQLERLHPGRGYRAVHSDISNSS